MAETMKFDLVSPERRLVSGEATSVQIPGADGDMTAMPDHAPTITTLRPGILSVELTDGVQEFAVTGGFAEITAEGVSVLAETAHTKGKDARADIEAYLAKARETHAEAEPDNRDVAEKIIADLEDVLEHMV